jgi:hypothetical protein
VEEQERVLDLAELEARLRPGGFSQGGFLGPFERLKEVIARDAERLDQIGVDYDDVAARLEALIEQGERRRERWSKAGEGLSVRVVAWKGFQLCPWTVAPDRGQCTAGSGVRFASLDWRIRRGRFGRELRGPGLIVHLIRDHHFFEGVDSPYRVDPEDLCGLLGLGRGLAR